MAAPIHQYVRVRTEGNVVIVTLCRDGKKNALNRGMYESMCSALESAAITSRIRAVVLTGARDCFCAGNDLADFIGEGKEIPEPFNFMRCLAAFEKPVVAAVEGLAVGVGTTLLSLCDLVYAGRSACFSTPFTDLGLTPEAASSLLFPEQMGMARAAALLLLGESIDASRAEAYGLITAVVADDSAESSAFEAAQRLASKPEEAVRQAKRLMRQPRLEQVLRTITEEERVFNERLRSPEAQQKLTRFAR